jgi:hypothetical protein
LLNRANEDRHYDKEDLDEAKELLRQAELKFRENK